MTLHDFFESNYRLKKLRSRSVNTIRLYRSSIKNLEKTLGRVATMEDLTDSSVEQLMADIIARGGSPYTANKERSQLLAIWRYACQIGMLTVWPTVMPEKEPERVPQAWFQEDLQQLFAAVDRLDGTVGSVQACEWWKALLSVALDTGERIGALMQCEWSWLDRNWLLIRAEARKGGKRDRRYMLSDDSLRMLSRLKQSNPSNAKLIFVWPFTRTSLWSQYAKVLRAAGLPHGPKDKFHRLRKTVASVVYAAGMDAQDVLDHQSRKTTLKYLDPRFVRTQQPSEILADWLRNPPARKTRDRQSG